MNTKNLLAGLITGAWMILAAGCGGSGSSGDDSPAPPASPPAANHSVGGSVFGLLGRLVLEINGGDVLNLDADGKFTFSNAVAAGSSYLVTVRNQPANQMCTVGNGSGAIAAADVTNITVNCSTLKRIVGGTVYGLDSSESVVLQNNSGDNLVVSSNGNFTFTTPVAQSGAYDVAVLTQPATQTCTVADGSGTAGDADIADVQVTCSTNAYTVGGTLSGLSGTVVLQNNGVDNLSRTGNGAFTLSTPVAQGASYNVTVLTQPAAQTCVVTNGSGTMSAANVTNVGLSCSANTTTLAVSVSDLALSAIGLTEYGVTATPSSGSARDLVITNTGSDPALNVSVTLPTWPAGTTTSANNCGSMLAAGDHCTITITPGATASSDGTNPCSGGTAPLPGVIQATADNANTVSSNVVVLSYGCIYQGGYVYAFDDTVSTSQSVGGKVAATSDQVTNSPGIAWSSDGLGGLAYDVLYGISELSTTSSPNPSSGQVTGQSACNGLTDGACNSNNIYVYYQNNAANAPISTSMYAAGLCKQTLSGYSDWFLPAICELGYGNACGTVGAPTTQNMQSNLVMFNSLSLLENTHWSSTESSAHLDSDAWNYSFNQFGFISQGGGSKNGMIAVRCSRYMDMAP